MEKTMRGTRFINVQQNTM